MRRGEKRLTLKDIAARAGVSEAAASFALNGRPGVSDETRERIRAVAAELNWSPSYAARALSGAKSDTIGLVTSRSAQSFGTESFFLRLMTGIQDVLAERHNALLLQVIGSVAEEIDTYQRWAIQSRVDGVVLVDLLVDDRRPAALAEARLPAVVAGGPDPTGILRSVSVDDAAAMGRIMRHLRNQGSRRPAYICGMAELSHIHARQLAFDQCLREHTFDGGMVISTDFSAASGASAVEQAINAEPRPDALIFDNEVLALAGMGVLSRLGLQVPHDVAVVSWEDTEVCAAVHPTLTALKRDPFAFGANVARALLDVIDGKPVQDRVEATPTLIARESTGARSARWAPLH